MSVESVQARPTVSTRARELLTPARLIWAVIVAELAIWYSIINSGSWAYDDNFWLEMAHVEGLRHWIASNLFGHWAVGYNGFYWVMSQLVPLDYRWALLVLLLCVGASMFLLERILDMLTGRTWVPLLAAAYLGISVLLIRSLEWLAAGLQTIPTIAADLLCLWAYLHYHRHPRFRWAVISAAGIAIGLLFYEKAAFMPLYVLILRVLFLGEDLRPRTIARSIWRERTIWLAYIAVLVVYVIAREAVNAGSVASAGLPTASQWAQAYWLMWSKSLTPAAVGLALPTPHVNTLQLVIGIVLQVAVVGAILLSGWRNWRARRAWTAIAACLLATGIVVGAARVRMFGPEVATDQRYLIDFVWLLPVFVCTAIWPRSEQVAAGAVAGQSRRPPRWGRVPAVLLAVAGVAYLCASVATAANWQDGWLGRSARVWAKNVESGLNRVASERPRPVIADDLTPGYIVEPSFLPYDFLSYALRDFGPKVQIDGPLTGALYTVGPLGQVQRAAASGVVAKFDNIAGCGRHPSTGIFVRERLPKPPPATGIPYYVLVSYSAGPGAKLALFVDQGMGYPATPNSLVDLGPGNGQSIGWLGNASPHGLILSSPAQYVCVRSLEVVTLGPAR